MSISRYSWHEIGLKTFGMRAARRAAFRLAAARGRSIVLMYHRVTPGGRTPSDVPPNIAVDRFQAQIETLGDVGEIVPLSDLLYEPSSRRRIRIAITFDDDDLCHVDHALPVLQMHGVPATFFLNGRRLYGLGPYWWMLLEQIVKEEGIEAARRLLGVRGDTAGALAAACEGTPAVDRLRNIVPDCRPQLLDEEGIRTLARAGMGIGFHTLNHPVLTAIPSDVVDHELQHGRDRLHEVAGTPIEFFAYPHGQTNRSIAGRARATGYRAAFATGARAITQNSDRFLLGRLGLRDLAADELLRFLALILSRHTRSPRES